MSNAECKQKLCLFTRKKDKKKLHGAFLILHVHRAKPKNGYDLNNSFVCAKEETKRLDSLRGRIVQKNMLVCFLHSWLITQPHYGPGLTNWLHMRMA